MRSSFRPGANNSSASARRIPCGSTPTSAMSPARRFPAATSLTAYAACCFSMNARCPADDAKWKTRRAQPWLGTLVDIGAHAHSERALAEGINAAFTAIARVHRALGGHDAKSELTRVNRRAVLTRQAISTDLRTVLACALALAACSDGAFDPTVGGELIALGLLPPLARHDRSATWRDVVLDEAGVAFKRPLVLDLNGIAKGYA